MSYTIKNAKKGYYSIWLDKTGNKYVVSDYNSENGMIITREVYENYDIAEKRFLALCEASNMQPVDIERDDFQSFD